MTSLYRVAVTFDSAVLPQVSEERFATYVRATRTTAEGWALYEWNQQLTTALTPLIQDLEVALRNTLNDQLKAHFGRDDWWAEPKLRLDDASAAMLTGALDRDHNRRRLGRGTIGSGKIVAELTLGCWVNMLGTGGHTSLGRPVDYEGRVWRPALRTGFTKPGTNAQGEVRRPQRREVHFRAQVFHRMRNRWAHHEPIFGGVKKPGTSDYVSVSEVVGGSIELLSWMSAQLAERHHGQTAVTDLLAEMPTQL